MPNTGQVPFIGDREAQQATDALMAGIFADEAQQFKAIGLVAPHVGVPIVRSALAQSAGINKRSDGEESRFFFEITSTPNLSPDSSAKLLGKIDELYEGRITPIIQALSLLAGRGFAPFLDPNYDQNRNFMRDTKYFAQVGATGNRG